MKIMVACVLGLAALVMSFASGGSPVHAGALEAAASATPVLARDTDTNGVKNRDELHRVVSGDGADNCIVNVQLEAGDQQPTAVSETDPPAAELAPAIQFVDAIRVVVVQTVSIAAPGLNAEDQVETPLSERLPVPATEPVSDPGTKTTDALAAPSGQSADAIVVAIVQSATVAARGQEANNDDDPPAADLRSTRTVPTFRETTTAHDNVE